MIEFARYFPQRVESLALVAPVGLRVAKRTYVLTRAPLVPDVLFRCFLQFSLLFGLDYEWADVKNPKYRTMVQAYKRRVAEEATALVGASATRAASSCRSSPNY